MFPCIRCYLILDLSAYCDASTARELSRQFSTNRSRRFGCAQDLEDARVAAREEHAAEAEDVRVALEEELEKLRDETRSRDAASQSQVDDLRRALENAKRSRLEAEERAESFEEATSKAQESLGVVSEELALEREETQRLRSRLGDTRASLEISQQEIVEIMRRAQEATAVSVQESAGRSAEFEARLQEAQSHSSKVESDFRQQMTDLTERMNREIDAAVARAARAEADVSARELQLSTSLDRGHELERALQAVRAQLEGEVPKPSRRPRAIPPPYY